MPFGIVPNPPIASPPKALSDRKECLGLRTSMLVRGRESATESGGAGTNRGHLGPTPGTAGPRESRDDGGVGNARPTASGRTRPPSTGRLAGCRLDEHWSAVDGPFGRPRQTSTTDGRLGAVAVANPEVRRPTRRPDGGGAEPRSSIPAGRPSPSGDPRRGTTPALDHRGAVRGVPFPCRRARRSSSPPAAYRSARTRARRRPASSHHRRPGVV